MGRGANGLEKILELGAMGLTSWRLEATAARDKIGFGGRSRRHNPGTEDRVNGV